MPSSTLHSGTIQTAAVACDETQSLSRLEEQLPPLLSVIAGMVDLTGFFTLGNIFTAHVTGNLVVVAAEAVRGGPVRWAQTLAIPVFIIALAAVWLFARAFYRSRSQLARLLLLVQFLLLIALLGFSVITKSSANRHGLTAGIAAMIAVSAMACQYALVRLAVPGAISTAVMTGNLTNAVLSVMDVLSSGRALMNVDTNRLKRSLLLLGGFLLGCAVSAIAISWLGDWAWSFPLVLSGVAIALPFGKTKTP
jgi:uncharacterized membrane protein YoaK (UPF0700 family)